MKMLILLLLIGCATVPTEPASVCYTSAENEALRKALIDQNETIEEMHWKAFMDKRHEDQTRTKIEGLKGYCS